MSWRFSTATAVWYQGAGSGMGETPGRGPPAAGPRRIAGTGAGGPVGSARLAPMPLGSYTARMPDLSKPYDVLVAGGGNAALKVNRLEIEVHAADGSVTYRNNFITDLPVDRDNVAELAAAGRARWKACPRT